MFPIIEVSGSDFERGFMQGRAAASPIECSIASYARLFAYWQGRDWDAVQKAALDYLPLLEKVAAPCVQEMRGIAEGSGRAFAEILALNARTELISHPRPIEVSPAYAAIRERNKARGVPQHSDENFVFPVDGAATAAASSALATAATATVGATTATAAPQLQGRARPPHADKPQECTTLGVFPQAAANQATLLAQNWDWYVDQRPACIVLRMRAAGKPDILTLTEAGILAKIGMNDAGLGVCLNILASHADGKKPGMTVHILLRRLLDTRSYEEALAVARSVPCAASSCITVMDARGKGASLEVTPAGVAEVAPRDGILVHTNHCVDPVALKDALPMPPISSSRPRFDKATELLHARRGAVDIDLFKTVLRDHSTVPGCICQHGDMALPPAQRVDTVTSVIMDLGARRMYVAADRPCQVHYQSILLG